MKMKHTVCVILCALLLAGLLAGCGGSGSRSATAATRPDVTEKEISVVATVFPAYDWARQIIGADNHRVALTLLLDKGTDFHSYQPTVEDIYKISTCDLFIYVGGESDKWVPDALAQAQNKDMKTICLLDTLGSAAKEEKVLEGMEAEEEEEEEGPAYDEHVWLSLRNARTLCAAIRDAMNELDNDEGKIYWPNFKAYDEKLSRLDSDYAEALEHSARKTLVFADRFPFRYLAEDYGLQCWAAFSGCSAETEASFETVNFLVNKVDELQLPYVMKLESSDSRLAETVIANTQGKNARILSLNSIQSVTAQDVAEGASYLGIMESNLEVLKQALN